MTARNLYTLIIQTTFPQITQIVALVFMQKCWYGGLRTSLPMNLDGGCQPSFNEHTHDDVQTRWIRYTDIKVVWPQINLAVLINKLLDTQLTLACKKVFFVFKKSQAFIDINNDDYKLYHIYGVFLTWVFLLKIFISNLSFEPYLDVLSTVGLRWI